MSTYDKMVAQLVKTSIDCKHVDKLRLSFKFPKEFDIHTVNDLPSDYPYHCLDQISTNKKAKSCNIRLQKIAVNYKFDLR